MSCNTRALRSVLLVINTMSNFHRCWTVEKLTHPCDHLYIIFVLYFHIFSLKSVNFDPSVSLYSFKASWKKFRRKRLHCTRRPWRYCQLSLSQLTKKSHVKHFSHRRETYMMAHCTRTSLVVAANTTQLFLFWVEHCSFCGFCFCFWQSKKNYELRCREADEAEQGSEKASVTSKNPDKVQ